MAKIVENLSGRRLIRISTDDMISLVREYQSLTHNINDYETIRKVLSSNCFYLPEDCQ